MTVPSYHQITRWMEIFNHLHENAQKIIMIYKLNILLTVGTNLLYGICIFSNSNYILAMHCKYYHISRYL